MRLKLCCGLPVFPDQNQFPDHQYCTDSDCGIRHIKSGPVGTSNIDIEEIHDCSEPYPVDQISDSPAENQGQRTCQQQIPGIAFYEIINDETYRQNRDADKENIAVINTAMPKNNNKCFFVRFPISFSCKILSVYYLHIRQT